jgi:hypothetical protein
MWTLLRAISFSMMMGAQQPASVRTMKKNLMMNSKSPMEEMGVAWRVFQMLTNIHVYRTAMSTSLQQEVEVEVEPCDYILWAFPVF